MPWRAHHDSVKNDVLTGATVTGGAKQLSLPSESLLRTITIHEREPGRRPSTCREEILPDKRWARAIGSFEIDIQPFLRVPKFRKPLEIENELMKGSLA